MKTVWFKVNDRAGNESAPRSVTILYFP